MKWLTVALAAFTTVVANSEKTEESLHDFKEWYQSMASENTAMEVRNSNWGLGLFATRDISKGEVVLRIPSQWVISGENVRKWYYVQQLSKSLTNHELLVWWLISERKKDSSSRFYVWLRMLPEKFYTPLQYSNDRLASIEPEDARKAAATNLKETKHTWVMLEKLLGEDIAFDDYLWARGVLSTRAWHLQGEEYLIPVAGMFNHALDDEDLSFDWTKYKGMRSQKFLTYHSLLTNGDAIVKSDRNVAQNNQVFESYGDNTNAIYFQHHGFVPDANPYECYKFQLQRYLTPDIELYSRKLDFLKTSKTQTSVCLHKDELSEPVLLFSAVLSVKPSKAKPCLKYGTSMSYKKLLYCANNEIATMKYAAKILKEELQLFETTSSEDKQLLDEGITDVEELAIVKYRLQQKLILESVIVTAKTMLQQARDRNQEKKNKNKERRISEEQDEEL